MASPPLQFIEPAGPPPEPDAMLEVPPTSGLQCRGAKDCPASPTGRPGRCLCPSPIPEGLSEAVGFCWSGKLKPNAWWCTVEDGRAFGNGVMIVQ